MPNKKGKLYPFLYNQEKGVNLGSRWWLSLRIMFKKIFHSFISIFVTHFFCLFGTFCACIYPSMCMKNDEWSFERNACEFSLTEFCSLSFWDTWSRIGCQQFIRLTSLFENISQQFMKLKLNQTELKYASKFKNQWKCFYKINSSF
jgi:hypothetical protein